jgi:hypothetical protein
VICGGDVIYGVHESATSPQKKVPAPAGSHIAFVIVEVQLKNPRDLQGSGENFPILCSQANAFNKYLLQLIARRRRASNSGCFGFFF